MLYRTLFVYVLFVTALSLRASAHSIKKAELTHISHQFSVFQDSSKVPLNIDQILKKDFLPVNGKGFGYTSSTIWYKTTLTTNSHHEYLLISPEFLSKFIIYTTQKNQIIDVAQRGTTIAKQDDELPVTKHSFNLPKGTYTYYIRFRCKTMIAPTFEKGDQNTVLRDNNFQSNLNFLYFGVMLFLLGYNIFLAITHKKTSNYYYTFYVFFVILSMAYVKGYLNNFLEWNWLMYHHHIITAFVTILLIQSIDKFTKTSQRYHLLRYVKNIIISMTILALTFIMLDFVRLGNNLMTKTVFIGSLWGLTVGITSLKDKSIVSTLIVLGFSSFIIGAVAHLLRFNNHLPHFWIFNNAYLIGSGLEVFFISTSFGININEMRKKKYLNQVKITQLAQQNEQLILNQNRVLEQRVQQRTSKLYEAYDEIQNSLNTLSEQKKRIESQNLNITESISYAKKIQDALLPQQQELKLSFINTEVFYQPKDIVSGDFYWFGKESDTTIIAVADCTGHGVPGAMMSSTGHHLLNKIVHQQKITSCNKILTQLHIELIELLQQRENSSDDGMDIQILCINNLTQKITYAGARNHLYYINQDNELEKLNADKITIGGAYTPYNTEFTSHNLPENWKNIYMCSDGYQDQFNENSKKYMVGRFKKLLSEIASLPLTQQKEEIIEHFKKWKGHAEQTDDVLVLLLENKSI